MENNYKFREHLLQIHKEDRRDFAIMKPETDELEIKNGVNIVIPKQSGRVLKNVARDLADYLLTSMQISACITYSEIVDARNEQVIYITTKEFMDICLEDADEYAGYCVQIEKDITICGFDERGAAQGVYYLEDLMNLRKAPFLKKETVYKKPLFSPRMVHSGYGLDNFPDAHLSEIAHAGMDAILVYVKSYNETSNTYMDLNEIIYRAEGYGIDVYAYSRIKSQCHPEDEGAYAYYDNLYGTLFKKHPKLKGVVLVGESIGFPSKDPRVSSLIPNEKWDFLYGEKETSSNFPCNDYPQWLELLKKVITKYNPNADIVLWTYNFNKTPLEDRIALIKNMPKGISLLSTFEKPEVIDYGNTKLACTDYTISFAGPGQNFLEEAAAAKKYGIKLYAMANTGGRTWDLGTVPYLPCPMQWNKRHDKIKECREKYGLSGIMESHHYGYFPSFIGELTKWAYTSNSPDFEEIAKKIATRDFRGEYVDIVLNAWKKFSEAITFCPPCIEDQYGPLRIGPAYPLSLNVHNAVTTVPFALHKNESIVRAMYQCFDCDYRRFTGNTLFPVRIKEEIRLMEQAIALMDEGTEALAKIAESDTALHMVNLAKYIANSFRTCVHVKKWYIRKNKLLSADNQKEMQRFAKEMHEIADAELENSRQTLPLVDFDSSLGWEPSMEYIGDRAHIEMKIRQTENMLKNELYYYEKGCI